MKTKPCPIQKNKQSYGHYNLLLSASFYKILQAF